MWIRGEVFISTPQPKKLARLLLIYWRGFLVNRPHHDAIISGRHETSTGSVHEPELPENAGKSSSAVQNFFVLDTNVLIHDLSFVEELVELSDQGKVFGPPECCESVRIRGTYLDSRWEAESNYCKTIDDDKLVIIAILALRAVSFKDNQSGNFAPDFIGLVKVGLQLKLT